MTNSLEKLLIWRKSSMSDKNFDVLLPIYDCTIQELLLTLQSIRQQSFTNYRLIVINDGSEQHGVTN